ncbi:MAG TPA: CNP1-like family protein [Burkholderiaceae bacterium]|nr:CNP1-like family protein [Burkholderiaceae bacterium]
MRLASLAFALAAGLAASPAFAEDPVRIIERGGDLHHRGYEPEQWKETEAPPPPSFDMKRLVPLAMPPYMSLKFGVDPQTMTVTPDGVVRYVVVAYREAGNATNAFYEAVRCSTDEYKTYARYAGDGWSQVANAEWKKIDDRNSIYTSELAKQSLCRGRAPRASVSDMVRELKRPEDYLR